MINNRQFRMNIEEFTTLLDAMDSVHKPFTDWDKHTELRRRLSDAIIWMEADWCQQLSDKH